MKIRSSEITPKNIYLSRREIMKVSSIVGAGALLSACGVTTPNNGAQANQNIADMAQSNDSAVTLVDELGDAANSFKEITNYNNFYEFTTDKEQVASVSRNFISSPWEVEVGGLVNNPKTFTLEDLLAFEQEERIYRLRCVEGWSMVIPWMGFPISKILNEVEPTSKAKFVKFESIYDLEQMPGQKSPWYEWPYVEGLRIDEAMNDLAILATGIYGEQLLPQNGAPVRLVVPWKYGFKSIKSIVKIELIDYIPTSLWMDAAPREYGFYANVNPVVPHPRWSQATERRIGEFSRRETLMFNGYVEDVAYLYEGMDLGENY